MTVNKLHGLRLHVVVYSNLALSKTQSLEPYYLINKSFQAQHVPILWKDGVLLIQGWILKLKKKHIKKGHQQLSSVWFFSLVSWFGYLAIENRNSLNQIIIRSNRQTEPQLNLASLYTRHLERLVGSVFLEDSCCLHSKFCFLPSRRFLVLKCRATRF